ncbi:NAD-dependent epimerase/dehydratase family protein [Ichthyenterobacterium magnum]|uniref:NAD-dependent epimerase/dehydratase family protein n=1 Tax=Ichthyenterobacterium magnum TaxID=1230530 RepID=A0A420DEX2_9FLAO|nr:NAD-dependent epimerase/dehydratase family protein [Ichthyenterobacterium magnum]RKE90854.1 NAD-dependent epimerase/dehydratase family protein [Ichthyenterobacterium magnum]
MKKIGIIGGSGFIDSDIPKLFLDQSFDVKISTSDINKKETYQHLMLLENADRLHVCELDINDKSALKDFVKDCDITVFNSNTSFQTINKLIY